MTDAKEDWALTMGINPEDEVHILKKALTTDKTPTAKWFRAEVAALFETKNLTGRRAAQRKLASNLAHDTRVLAEYKDPRAWIAKQIQGAIDEIQFQVETDGGISAADELCNHYTALSEQLMSSNK